jgi:VIT1/CCC1 family predicted Fe2+/Mn2+ transporter
MGSLEERGRNLLTLRAVQQEVDPGKARQTIANALPPALSSVLKEEELEAMRARLVQLPPPQAKPRLTMEDALGALAVCLLVFLSTFPVVIPFFFAETIQPALRVSNAIAIAMLFLCGYVFAQSAGLRPWPTGLVMVAVGVALTAVAIALGG